MEQEPFVPEFARDDHTTRPEHNRVALDVGLSNVAVHTVDRTDHRMVYNLYVSGAMYAMSLRVTLRQGTELARAFKEAVTLKQPRLSWLRVPPYVCPLVLTDGDAEDDQVFYATAEDRFRLQCHVFQRTSFPFAEIPLQLWHALMAFPPCELPAIYGAEIGSSTFLAPHLHLAAVAHVALPSSSRHGEAPAAQARWFFLRLAAVCLYMRIAELPLEFQPAVIDLFFTQVAHHGGQGTLEALNVESVADELGHLFEHQKATWASLCLNLRLFALSFLLLVARLNGQSIAHHELPDGLAHDMLAPLLYHLWADQERFAVASLRVPLDAWHDGVFRSSRGLTLLAGQVCARVRLLVLALTAANTQLLTRREALGRLMLQLRRRDVKCVLEMVTQMRRPVHVLWPDTLPVFLAAHVLQPDRVHLVELYNKQTCVFDTLATLEENDLALWGLRSFFRFAAPADLALVLPDCRVHLHLGWLTRGLVAFLTEQRVLLPRVMQGLWADLLALARAGAQVPARFVTTVDQARQAVDVLLACVQRLPTASARAEALDRGQRFLQLLLRPGAQARFARVTPPLVLPVLHPPELQTLVARALEPLREATWRHSAQRTAWRRWSRDRVVHSAELAAVVEALDADESGAFVQHGPLKQPEAGTVELPPLASRVLAIAALSSVEQLERLLPAAQHLHVLAPATLPLQAPVELTLRMPYDTLERPNPRACPPALAAVQREVLRAFVGPQCVGDERVPLTLTWALLDATLRLLELGVRPLVAPQTAPEVGSLVQTALEDVTRARDYPLAYYDDALARQPRVFFYHSDILGPVSLRDSPLLSDLAEQVEAWSYHRGEMHYNPNDIVAEYTSMETLLDGQTLRRHPCENWASYEMTPMTLMDDRACGGCGPCRAAH